MIHRCPYGTYREFDTTADLGIDVQASSLPKLFSAAAYAMFDRISDLKNRHSTIQLNVTLSSTSVKELIVDWLNELIYLCDTRDCIFFEFDVMIYANQLSAIVRGDLFNPEQDAVRHAIKAATYHQLTLVERSGSHYLRVIFDI